MAQSPCDVVGAGEGGVEEMVTFMSDDQVMWACLRFEFGGGSFKRTKSVFLHFNGEDTKTVSRGQANSKTDAVREFLRGKDGVFHAAVIRMRVEEVTLESVMDEVSKTVIVDSMASSAQLAKEYQEQIALAKAEAAAKKEAEKQRKQAQLTALKDVGRAHGTQNWALVEPDVEKFPLLDFGGGGVDECRAKALEHKDKVLYGMIRLVFGEGKMARPKWIFIHVIGPDCPVVKRGRWNALRPGMEKKFEKLANISSSISDLDAVDLTAETLEAELKKCSVADNDVKASRGTVIDTKKFKKKLEGNAGDAAVQAAAAAAAGLEASGEAQHEEEEEQQQEEEEDKEGLDVASLFSEVKEDTGPPNHNKSVWEILDMIRHQNTANWALFAIKKKG